MSDYVSPVGVRWECPCGFSTTQPWPAYDVAEVEAALIPHIIHIAQGKDAELTALRTEYEDRVEKDTRYLTALRTREAAFREALTYLCDWSREENLYGGALWAGAVYDKTSAVLAAHPPQEPETP